MRSFHLSLLAFIIASRLFCFAADEPVSDSVASFPIVQSGINALAVDAAGNRFVTGSFYDAQDFNPGAGLDAKKPLGYSDLFLTRFNADGSYAWTATLGVAEGGTYGSALVLRGNIVYVTGSQYVYSTRPAGVPGNSAIVAAFDATTGKLMTAFGTNGVASYVGSTGASANAIAVSGQTLFVAGEVFPDYSNIAVDPPAPDTSPNGKLVSLTAESHAFVWSLDAVSGKSTASFGQNGVNVLIGISGYASAHGLAFSNGGLFVVGTISVSNYIPLDAGVVSGKPVAATTTSISRKVSGSLPIYNYYSTHSAFVAALDPATGALNAGFSNSGVKTIGSNTEAVTGNAIVASNTALYITGGRTLLPAPTPVIDPKPSGKTAIAPTPANVNSDCYILAIEPKSGAEISGFGTNGLKLFGRQFNDSGTALALEGNALYVTGTYGNLSGPGGDVYPLASDGVKGGAPAALNGSGSTPTNKPANNPNVIGGKPKRLPRSISAGANTAANNAPGKSDAANSLLPIYGYSFGTTDAFVLALDAQTGAAITSFSTDGLQTFGGSDSDAGTGIAVSKGQVIVAGYAYSSDCGIGGIGAAGKIDATNWYGFLLALDTATGGGGGTEENRAPIVKAAGYYDDGTTFDVKLSEHPAKGADAQYNFDAWLYPKILDDGLPNPPGKFTVKWEKVSGPGVVTFQDSAQSYSGVNFQTVGQYVLKLTASDSVLSASDTLTVNVSQNHAPVFSSSPTFAPGSAQTGVELTFSASATDKDSDDLWYWWDFGDGGYGYDASTTYTFLAPGTYTVRVYASDGIDETESKISVTVTGDPIFQVDDCQFIVDFNGKSRSKLNLRGTVGGLLKDFNPNNAVVSLNAGGAQASFKLDASGRSSGSSGTFALKRKKAGWSFSAKISSAGIDTSTANANNALGLSNSAAKNVQASVPVSLQINDMSFNGARTVNYSTAKGVAKGR